MAGGGVTEQLFPGIYLGLCVNNVDPEGFSRITATVPQVFGNNTSATDWAWPVPAEGNVAIPNPGQKVWIMFQGGDIEHPVWLGSTPSSSGGTGLPVADPSGTYHVDTTTYSNTVTGTGNLSTAVFPGETAALAIAQQGDAFPRVILGSDQVTGLSLGTGAYDPESAHGATVSTSNDGTTLELSGYDSVILSSGAGGGGIGVSTEFGGHGTTFLINAANLAGLPNPPGASGNTNFGLTDDGRIYWWAWNGSSWVQIAPASGVPVVRHFPFAYNTSGLATGATIYTPTVGDLLLDAWLEIDVPWNSAPAALFDVGTFTSHHVGLFGWAWAPIDMKQGDTTFDAIQLKSTPTLAETSVPYIVAFNDVVSGGGPALTTATVSFFNSGDGARFPAKFTTTNPLKIVVSQDGTNTGADPGATAGTATLFLKTVTPS